MRNRFISGIFTILLSVFIIFSCTTNDSITGNSDRSVEKPQNSDNTNSDDFNDWFEALGIPYASGEDVFERVNESILANICFFAYLLGIESDDFENIDATFSKSKSNLYSFRDDYLDKSSKGKSYIASYYILSKYGIENNLVNQYYGEHLDLVMESIKLAKNVQTNNSDRIIINEDLSDKLDQIIKIYRNHSNHRDIDPILDYLEKDLVKYENQPKSLIAKDFK